jgi:hypothetical protein
VAFQVFAQTATSWCADYSVGCTGCDHVLFYDALGGDHFVRNGMNIVTDLIAFEVDIHHLRGYITCICLSPELA